MTELRRNTREVLERVHKTKRPLLLTVDGKPDAVLMDAKTYEKHLKAMNLAALLVQGEADIAAGRVRPARDFFREFMNARNIPG